MSERSDRTAALQTRLNALVGAADLPWKRERLMVLDAQISEPGFWDAPDEAAATNQERTRVAEEIEYLDGLTASLSETVELLEMVEAEGDEDDLAGLDEDMASIEDRWKSLELSGNWKKHLSAGE